MRAIERGGAFQLKVDGLDQLDKMLDNVGYAVYRKSMKNAVGFAMKPVMKAAKDRVRSVSNTVADSIGSKTVMYAKNGVAVAIVGPAKKYTVVGEDGKKRKSFTEGGQSAKAAGRKVHNPAHTAHLIERGTKPHVIKSDKPMGADGRFGYKVDHPGTAPHPFMRPALEQNQQLVIQRFADQARKAIIKNAKAEFNKGGKVRV